MHTLFLFRTVTLTFLFFLRVTSNKPVVRRPILKCFSHFNGDEVAFGRTKGSILNPNKNVRTEKVVNYPNPRIRNGSPATSAQLPGASQRFISTNPTAPIERLANVEATAPPPHRIPITASKAGRSGYPKISGRVFRVSGISGFQKYYPKLV